jgi:lipopolysaccharide biosynthesis glycosyltransferase
MTAVAFFGDRNVRVALHVAFASTAANWLGPEPLEIHFFHSGLAPADLAALRATVAAAKTNVTLRDAPFDAGRVRRWRSLYGSHMPYGRLFLPELLPQHDEVVYLDADVIVEMDVRELLCAGGGAGAVAAMKAWDFAHSHDAALAAELGIAGDEPYFHSGLLVFRLHRWRSDGLLAKCLDFGDCYAGKLQSHDQTILNFVCRGHIDPLPKELTTHLYPTDAEPPHAATTIHNFCGSPKPFDPLGNVLNAHFGLFERWLARTAMAGWSPNSVAQLQQVGRNLRLLKPMLSAAARMAAKSFRRR